jgi:hypothetical protein
MTIRGIDLLLEKSLWDIYKECLRRLPPSEFNLKLTIVVCFALISDCAYFPEKYLDRLVLVRSLAELGLGFGSTILGFLIAGFTIFATLSKPEMFLRMHETEHPRAKISYFKVNFFAFVEVFVIYIVFLIACLLLKLFGEKGGLLSSLVQQSRLNPWQGYIISDTWAVNIAFVLLAGLAFYSLLALKSFVYNTYHTVVTAIVWSFNPPKAARQKRPARSAVLRVRAKLRGKNTK